MVCCFFGHRDTPQDIRPLIKETVLKLVEENDDVVFYVGNQGGFDAMAHGVLKELSETDPRIVYSVVLAYMPGEKGEFDGDLYNDTMYPEGLETVPRKFAISTRNKWMVEKADTVICYKVVDFGGAAQFVNMAARRGKRIINLAER